MSDPKRTAFDPDDDAPELAEARLDDAVLFDGDQAIPDAREGQSRANAVLSSRVAKDPD